MNRDIDHERLATTLRPRAAGEDHLRRAQLSTTTPPSRASTCRRSRCSSGSSRTRCSTRAADRPSARNRARRRRGRAGDRDRPAGVATSTSLTLSTLSRATSARTTSARATFSSRTVSGSARRASTRSVRSRQSSCRWSRSATRDGLRVVQRLNGEVIQDSSTDAMIFGVPEIVAHASSVFTLEPGDLILTGTPAGVGVFRDPKISLAGGDLRRGRGRAGRDPRRTRLSPPSFG